MKTSKQIKQVPDHKIMQGVPPGQFVTQKFPVLSYGPTPTIELSNWELKITGLVPNEISFNWEQFLELPWTSLRSDFHCVTQWSRLDNVWEGVLFDDICNIAKPDSRAKYVIAHSYGGYTTNVAIDTLKIGKAIIANKIDGEELSPDHGWPARLVVHNRYGWKSAKWLSHIEFVSDDRPGFWEVRGYHNNGDPWKEERFWPELG